MPFSLRDYQVDATDRAFSATSSGYLAPVISMATGSGKSVVIAEAVRRQVEASDLCVVLLTHRTEIVHHLARTIARHTGWPVGIEMAGLESHGEMVVVGSVGTLGRKDRARLRKFNPAAFGMGIVDECHHSILSNNGYAIPAQHFGRLDWRRMPRRDGPFWMGFTATTGRADGVTLGGMFDTLAVDIPLDWCIANGHLVPPRAERILSSTKLDDLRRRGDDFSPEELGRRINNPERNQLIVRHYLDHGESRQFIAFVPTIAHARQLARMFQACDVPAVAVDHTTPQRDREAAIAGYESGEVMGLVNVGVFTEGTDLPMCSLLYLARPTFSQTLATQMIGRGLRTHGGKVDCRLVDIADVTSHELVTVASLLGHCCWPDCDKAASPEREVIELPTLPPAGEALPSPEWDPLHQDNNLDLAVDPGRWYRTDVGWTIVPSYYERYDLTDQGEDGWLVTAQIDHQWIIIENYMPKGEVQDWFQVMFDLSNLHRDAYEVRPTVWPTRVEAVNYATKLVRRYHPVAPPAPQDTDCFLPAGPVTRLEKVAALLREENVM